MPTPHEAKMILNLNPVRVLLLPCNISNLSFAHGRVLMNVVISWGISCATRILTPEIKYFFHERWLLPFSLITNYSLIDTQADWQWVPTKRGRLVSI
jgi:hypothetical protein